MMNGARDLRITPAEAVALADLDGMLSDLEIVQAIFEAFRPKFQKATPGGYSFVWSCYYAALFHAGRIQGVREERARRKAAAAREAARSGAE